MNKTSVILVATCLAAFLWSLPRENNPAAGTSHQANGKKDQTHHADDLPATTRTKVVREVKSATATTSSVVDDPDASLPSIEETLRAARSNVFNFKHHLCLCQCDLDERKIMDVLVKANLKWPRIGDELGTVAMEHNLRVREEEAMRMVEKDPAKAVAFMDAQIRYEQEKRATLLAAAPWRESLLENATGDSQLFAKMLESLPDSNFDGMVDENLALVAQSRTLQEATLANSFKRPPHVRLKTLARLADQGLLEGSSYQQRAHAELVSLIGSVPAGNGSWLQEVAQKL
jgi:hypothetical protein